MKMKSMTGDEVYVSSADGMHSIRIQPDEWTEVSNKHKLASLALMKGCIGEGMNESAFADEVEEMPAPAKSVAMKRIMEIIRKMRTGGVEGDYASSTGMPNLKRLSGYAGFPVSREEMSEALYAIEQEDAAASND